MPLQPPSLSSLPATVPLPPLRQISNRLSRLSRTPVADLNTLVPTLSVLPSPTTAPNIVPPLLPSSKRQRLDTLHKLPDELSKCISRDSRLFAQLGFETLVGQRRSRGDFASLDKIRSHPAHRLLRQYKSRGAPVVLSTAPWTPDQVRAAIDRGPHKSALEYVDFLRKEMVDMINKGHWMVLPFSQAQHLPKLRASPIGVVPQRTRPL